MSVGSRIKHLRDSLGLSLNAFSKELGVCEKVLRSWELNEAKNSWLSNIFNIY